MSETLDERRIRLGEFFEMKYAIPDVTAADAKRKAMNTAGHRQRVYRNHHEGVCYSCGKAAGGFFRCLSCRNKVNNNRYKNSVN